MLDVREVQDDTEGSESEADACNTTCTVTTVYEYMQ